MHLTPGDQVELPPLPALPAAALPPSSSGADLAVEESGEPLQLIEGTMCRPIYSELGLRQATPKMWVRRSVNAKLIEAGGRLPPGFELVVLDAWRPRVLQRELLRYYEAKFGSVDEFVADPESLAPPPHSTGGVVDVTLSYGGVALALGTDFDEFDEAARPEWYEEREPDGVIAQLRRLLSFAMSTAGFVVYPLEWWHWSYGDNRWAAAKGLEAATYGEILHAPAY